MSEPTSARRSPGIDALRALAVVAMVVGHTADGLLSAQARALPWIQSYWSFRALTAPLFFFVSGWAVMASVERAALSGWPLLRARLPRVLLLFALAYLLRFPGWDLPGLLTLEPKVIRHVLGFDALHCIGASLFLGALLLSLSSGFRSRVAALALLAIGVPLLSELANRFGMGEGVPLPLRASLATEAASPFPLFPWAGYFFIGALFALAFTRVPDQLGRALALGLAAAALIVFTFGLGPKVLPRLSPMLFAWRLGWVLAIASVMMLLPVGLTRHLAPIGRASLVVYVAHVPVVYGWSGLAGLDVRLGKTLGPLQAVGVAALLLVFGLTLAALVEKGRRLVRARPLSLSRASRSRSLVSERGAELVTIQQAQADGLMHVLGEHVATIAQVGDGARHLEDAADGARR